MARLFEMDLSRGVNHHRSILQNFGPKNLTNLSVVITHGLLDHELSSVHIDDFP